MVRVKLRKCFGERTKRELEAGASKVRAARRRRAPRAARTCDGAD